MAILVGVNPGGKGKFSVVSLYWTGRWPALLIGSRLFSGVDDVLKNIIGTSGEWGELTHTAIAAPLTWSGSPSGWRECDRQLASMLPEWAPSTWLRSPNALPGAVSVQGPALTWALAQEIKQDQIPKHGVVETHPRLCWSLIASDLRDAVLGYRDRDTTSQGRNGHTHRLLNRLVEPGMVRMETSSPDSPDEVDAVLCALVALGCAFPEAGLVMRELHGGDLHPVGNRPIAVLRALP